jgi:hypothetical protein
LSGVPFDYHPIECDVGMAQKTPLVEDIEKTLRALDQLPVDGSPEFDRLSSRVRAAGCRLIVCDIAPLGLAVARRLEVPGVLVENFTWDWIYDAYHDAGFGPYGARFADDFASAELRIQTEPVCRRVESAVSVAPVSREGRNSREETRDRLGVEEEQPLVLLSQPGAGLSRRSLEIFDQYFDGVRFIVPGDHVERVETDGPVIRVPFFGSFFHPDLVRASDVVVAKLGYSTVAEVYHAATAYAYLRRPHFPESPILEGFVRDNIPSAALACDWFDSPETADVIRGLLNAPRATKDRPNGADKAAQLILDVC